MIQTIRLMATVDENHRLVIDVPDEIPAGPVELVITTVKTGNGEQVEPPETQELTREEARRRLLAAGILSTAQYAPPDAEELSPEEEERIGRLLAADGKTVLEMVNEEREERF